MKHEKCTKITLYVRFLLPSYPGSLEIPYCELVSRVRPRTPRIPKTPKISTVRGKTLTDYGFIELVGRFCRFQLDVSE